MYIDDHWQMNQLKSIDAVIADNSVAVSDPDGTLGNAGIWLRFLADALVETNRVTGKGCTAMYLGRIAYSTILANNLQGFTANDPYCFGVAAPIIFWADGLGYAHDNLVVGGGARLSSAVFDIPQLLGLNPNNTLVGVTSLAGNPPGPIISGAMQNKRLLR